VVLSAHITLNGLTVIEGTINFPYEGAWTSTLTIESDVAPTGRVTIEGPGLDLTGTVMGGGSAFSRTTVRIVGGAGQLVRSIGPRWWRKAPLRLPLGDVCDQAGETLSTSIASSILDQQLPAWTRAEGRAALELDALASLVGGIWRVRDDGTIWMGIDTWPTLEIDHRVTDVHVAQRWREIALDDYSVRPGVVLDGMHLGRVTYRITGDRVRCELSGINP
jgi:hypothetical protein